MKAKVTRACGTCVEGNDEEELVEKTQTRLQDKHGLAYRRDEILFVEV